MFRNLLLTTILSTVIFACSTEAPQPSQSAVFSKTENAGTYQLTQPLAGVTAYKFFKLDAKKAKPTSVADLTKALAPFKPVILTADLNQTPIVIPGATFGTNELYSTHGVTYNFPVFSTKDKALNKAVEQKFVGNFRSPNDTSPGDAGGKAVSVHFSTPVNYFGAFFEGAPGLDLTENLSFVVDGQVVAQQYVLDGMPVFIGVNLPTKFSDLQIVPTGGINQAFLMDRPSLK